MKKTLTMITLLAGAVSVYSQGNLSEVTYGGQIRQAIYGTQATGNYTATYGGFTVSEIVGSSPTTLTTAELPSGTTAYAAGTALSGSGYSYEVLVGPAGITTLSGTVNGVGLLPFGATNGAAGAVGAVVGGFYTAPARKIGFATPVGSFSLPTASYFGAGNQVSVAIAAWNNEGGTVTSLAAAQAGLDPWGVSPVAQTVTAGGLTTGTGAAVALDTESFSLGTSVPEPSTIALGVMGASALLFRRRK